MLVTTNLKPKLLTISILFCITLTACQHPLTALPQPAPASPFTVSVEVDTSRLQAVDPEEVRDILKGTKVDMVALSPHFNSTASRPDWYEWGRFSNRVSPTSLKIDPTLPPDSIKAYAPRSLDGTTLLLINTTERPAKVSLRLKTGAGFYRMEHLSFTQPPPNPDTKEAVAPQASLLALAGVELPQTGTISRTLTLEAGQVSLVRYTEIGSLTRRAYQTALSHTAKLAYRNASAANRLRAILKEGEPYLIAVSPTRTTKRFASFQRLLLSYSEAQSRIRNYMQQNRVQQEDGKPISDALQQFESGLGEIGGISAGLNAYLRVTKGTDDPTMPNMHAYTAIVTLASGGTKGVQNVTLDIDRKTLPSGVLCVPSEPETFAALAPGQTVRTTFHLRVPMGQEFSSRMCVGDVSYRFSGILLSLFPQSW